MKYRSLHSSKNALCKVPAKWQTGLIGTSDGFESTKNKTGTAKKKRKVLGICFVLVSGAYYNQRSS